MAAVPVPNFQIKRGDTAPVLIVTLNDRLGVAVDLSTATGVVFVMRSTLAATNTVPLVTGSCVVSDQTTSAGQVTYSWVAGDTNHAGAFLGEFVVTWATGREQTFPTVGYITIQVVDDLESHLSSLAMAGPMGIVQTSDAGVKEQLSVKCAATSAPQLTDEDLDRLVSYARRPNGTYAINRAAAEGWRWKAAKAASGFSFSADGTSVNKTMLMDHCLLMAKSFTASQVRTVQVDTQLATGEQDWYTTAPIA